MVASTGPALVVRETQLAVVDRLRATHPPADGGADLVGRTIAAALVVVAALRAWAVVRVDAQDIPAVRIRQGAEGVAHGIVIPTEAFAEVRAVGLPT
jgi:hypothetical protein